jgi:hypothetical protein
MHLAWIACQHDPQLDLQRHGQVMVEKLFDSSNSTVPASAQSVLTPQYGQIKLYNTIYQYVNINLGIE